MTNNLEKISEEDIQEIQKLLGNRLEDLGTFIDEKFNFRELRDIGHCINILADGDFENISGNKSIIYETLKKAGYGEKAIILPLNLFKGYIPPKE